MNITPLASLLRRAGASRLTIWGSALALGAAGLGIASPALAQYNQELRNDMRHCAGERPAVMVTVDGVKSSSGKVRVQAYRATAADWLQKGRWLSRIEAPAKAGTMTFCVPVEAAGRYAIAVRHDVNGNGGTDHGRGNVMWLLGGPVAGGQVLGDWPGLETPALADGRDLAVANDFRQVLATVLRRHLGLSETALATVFPQSPQTWRHADKLLRA
jgi:uncharacterized protein (DUF2141 family)